VVGRNLNWKASPTCYIEIDPGTINVLTCACDDFHTCTITCHHDDVALYEEITTASDCTFILIT